MQSSFNVIKNNNVLKQGNKEIVTLFDNINEREAKEKDARSNIESYENLAKTMIENARRQSEQILSNAYNEVQNIEQNALDKIALMEKEAFNKAYNEGKEKGYQDAYESTIVKTAEECENIRRNIDEMLRGAQKEYNKYLVDKKDELNRLIVSIAESVLKREVKDKDAINGMIFDVIEASKDAKSFLIKTKSKYVEELKIQTISWKDQLAFKGDIFVIADEAIEEGSALIDKGNGKVEVSIDLALAKVKEILEGND